MPSSHRIALKKLLQSVKHRIAQDEARIMKATSDDERTKPVEELADLHIRYDELMDSLRGEID